MYGVKLQGELGLTMNVLRVVSGEEGLKCVNEDQEWEWTHQTTFPVSITRGDAKLLHGCGLV